MDAAATAFTIKEWIEEKVFTFAHSFLSHCLQNDSNSLLAGALVRANLLLFFRENFVRSLIVFNCFVSHIISIYTSYLHSSTQFVYMLVFGCGCAICEYAMELSAYAKMFEHMR